MKAPRLRLGRDRKLHGSRVFASIRAAGQRRACGCLILNWRRLEGSPENRAARLGVVTSRRLGGAVVRSRARRLLREAFRIQQHRVVSSVDVVLIARPSMVGKPIAVVMRDLQRALKEAGLWNAAAEGAAATVASSREHAPSDSGRTSPAPGSGSGQPILEKGRPCTDPS